jgi:hypothetical protein
MENSLTTYQAKAKGIFDQKGGTLGMTLIALGVVAVIIFSQSILAFAHTILGLIVTVGFIGVILFLATNKEFRNIVGVSYMMAIHWLLGRVIEMNPIAILDGSLRSMYKKIDDAEAKMNDMNGIRLKWKDRVAQKKKETQDCLDRIEVYKKKLNAAVEVLEKQKWQGKIYVDQRQAARLVDITKEYISLQDQSENWYKILNKIMEGGKLTAEDAENELKILKEKYEMVKDSHSAFKSMMSILKGDPDDLANCAIASDIITKDIQDKVGEMDRVLNGTGNMIDKMDTDQEVYAIKGNDISEQYQKLGIDSLFTKLEVLPSAQLNKLQASNMTSDTSVAQKSAAKYFTN